jgi:CRISPR system Cascade subunit CasE
MSGPLHMVSMVLDMGDVYARVGRNIDDGYSVHCVLTSLFGDLAPRPFWLREADGRWLRLLGYGRAPAGELREHADAFSEPELHAMCGWDRLASKRMPASFAAGRRLGFEVRACPVVRLTRAVEDPGGPRSGPRSYAKGTELDVFQAGRLTGDRETSRDAAYRGWLAGRLAAGGAEVVNAEMVRFSLKKLWRRPQDGARKGRRLVRPDVQFRGTLRVGDPERFSGLLAGGVGRHAAFGFGMLLLRP